jgi:hypothetical protein
MDSRNSDSLDQKKEILQRSLRSLRKQVSNGQLIDLLADMNAAGALVLREEIGGAPECWRNFSWLVVLSWVSTAFCRAGSKPVLPTFPVIGFCQADEWRK